MIADPRSLVLTNREADIALRLARPNKEVRAIARKVADLAYAVYGPPCDDPKGLTWMTYETRMRDLPQAAWIAAQIQAEGLKEPQTYANDAEALIFCIQHGLGKTILPRIVGDAISGITRYEQYQCNLTREVWLLLHPDLQQTKKIRVVIDWAVELFAAPNGAK
jgi:DNA-binding transcriptional LysR family regulator